MGGLVPGVLFSIFAMVISFFICRKQGVGAPKKFSWRGLAQKTREGIWALTALDRHALATSSAGCSLRLEAAVVGVLYALLVGFFFIPQGTDRSRTCPASSSTPQATTAIVMLMVVGAFLYSWIITVDQVPQMVARFILGISTNPSGRAVHVRRLVHRGRHVHRSGRQHRALLIPVLFPVTPGVGDRPGVLRGGHRRGARNRLVTPPVGASLFITCDISKTPLIDAFKVSLPYLGRGVANADADDSVSRDRDAFPQTGWLGNNQRRACVMSHLNERKEHNRLTPEQRSKGCRTQGKGANHALSHREDVQGGRPWSFRGVHVLHGHRRCPYISGAS